MVIAVLAANGRSGNSFVEAALAAGHTVRAGVFNSSSLQARDGLDIVHCDATVKADVVALISGADAVVSFIGHVKGSAPRVQRTAMTVLITAMGEAGIRRVVSLTGTGVRFDGDIIGPVDRLLNTAVGVIDPDRVNDGIEHVDVLKTSGLDWTIIRVLKLQSFASHPFVLREHGPTRWYVNRAEVAQAVLQVLEQASFIQSAPILSKR